MYFPYLRGRQYELLALRDLLNEDLLSPHVIPIIEPVKVASTILTTINAFNKKEREFIIVRTPKVGSFISDGKKEKYSDTYDKIINALRAENIISGIIIEDRTKGSVGRIVKSGVPKSNMAAFCFESDKIELLLSLFDDFAPKYNVIPYSPAFRRVRNGKRVMIEDKFKKQSRNTDYLNCEDEFFSDDHLYFEDDGYAGFSDYSIVGDEYLESGFAPYAVAIHIVYFDDDKNLRVHHFVSDTNDDISDPANKFYEALSKLVEWNKTKKLNTKAIKTFLEMYEAQSYPGLGVVKKLSIMHHIELMGNYLDEVHK